MQVRHRRGHGKDVGAGRERVGTSRESTYFFLGGADLPSLFMRVLRPLQEREHGEGTLPAWQGRVGTGDAGMGAVNGGAGGRRVSEDTLGARTWARTVRTKARKRRTNIFIEIIHVTEEWIVCIIRSYLCNIHAVLEDVMSATNWKDLDRIMWDPVFKVVGNDIISHFGFHIG